MHIKSVHDRHIDFLCNLCDKRFNTKGTLKRHVMAIHEKITAFKCDTCEKCYKRKDTLSTHVRTVHVKLVANVLHKKDVKRHVKSVHENQEGNTSGKMKLNKVE